MAELQQEKNKLLTSETDVNKLQNKISKDHKDQKENKTTFVQKIDLFFSYIWPLYILENFSNLYVSRAEEEMNWFWALTNFKAPSKIWFYWILLSSFITNILYESYRNRLNENITVSKYNLFAIRTLILCIFCELCYILGLVYIYFKTRTRISLLQSLIYKFASSERAYHTTCIRVKNEICRTKWFPFIFYSVIKAYFYSVYIFTSIIIHTCTRWALKLVNIYVLKENNKDYTNKNTIVENSTSIDVKNRMLSTILDIVVVLAIKTYGNVFFCANLIEAITTQDHSHIYKSLIKIVLFWAVYSYLTMIYIKQYVLKETIVGAPAVSVLQSFLMAFYSMVMLMKKISSSIKSFFNKKISEDDTLGDSETKKQAMLRVCEKVILVCFLNTHHCFWKIGVFYLYKKKADSVNCINKSYFSNSLNRSLRALYWKATTYIFVLVLAAYFSNKKQKTKTSKINAISMLCFSVMVYPMILVLLIEKGIVDPSNGTMYYNIMSYSLRIALFKTEILACLGNKYLGEFVVTADTIADILADFCGRIIENLRYAPYIGFILCVSSLMSYLRLLYIVEEEQNVLRKKAKQKLSELSENVEPSTLETAKPQVQIMKLMQILKEEQDQKDKITFYGLLEESK